MSTIKTGTTLTTAYQVEGDTTGALVIQTGASPTTAVTIGSDQSTTLAGTLNLASQNMTPYTGFKNRLINSDMRIDQRNAGASVTPTASTYTLDRWRLGASVASKVSVQQSTVAPEGFKNSVLITSLSSYSITGAEEINFGQRIEGLNIADLGWGTASAKPVTFSFWVRSSLTGLFSGAIKNLDNSRAYVFSYTINAANTWEQKSVTIEGDTTGTWATSSDIGIIAQFCIASASYLNSANVWYSTNTVGVTGTTQLVATSGATWYVTGVQLEKGSTATSFDYRPYGTELALCQRYYYKMISPSASELYIANGFYYSSGLFAFVYSFPVTMRTAPALDYVTGTNYYKIYSGGTMDSIDGFSAVRMHPNGGGADATAGVSGVTGYGGGITTSNAAASVAFTAEL